jgi:hypothetical protein
VKKIKMEIKKRMLMRRVRNNARRCEERHCDTSAGITLLSQ